MKPRLVEKENFTVEFYHHDCARPPGIAGLNLNSTAVWFKFSDENIWYRATYKSILRNEEWVDVCDTKEHVLEAIYEYEWPRTLAS